LKFGQVVYHILLLHLSLSFPDLRARTRRKVQDVVLAHDVRSHPSSWLYKKSEKGSIGNGLNYTKTGIYSHDRLPPN
jgi:hypothetical protein